MHKPPEQYLFLRRLVWHGMMGMALGIVFAGVLLFSHVSTLALLDNAGDLSSRLIFLVAVGLFFGIGALLTGAVFLVSDEIIG